MGRPRLYSTEEARLAAGRERSHRYYHSNRDSVLEKRRLQYKNSKASQDKCKKGQRGCRRVVPLTEEERKLRNCIKSARHYQRKKSEVRSRRLNGRSNGNPSAIPSAPRVPFRALWERRLVHYMDRLPDLLGNRTCVQFLDQMVDDYSKEGATSSLSDVGHSFITHLETLYSFQGEILNKFGAGAETGKVGQAILDVKTVIGYLQDLELHAMEHGQAGLLEEWTKGRLLYQRRVK